MKFPKTKRGYTLVLTYSHFELEPVVFPATPTKPERIKWCHKLLSYKYKKNKPFDPLEFETEESLLKKLRKEIANAKK